jgi:hypothetical protein
MRVENTVNMENKENITAGFNILKSNFTFEKKLNETNLAEAL